MPTYLCLLLRPPDLDEGEGPDQERRRDGRPHVGLERPDDGPEGRERPRQRRDERHLVGVEGVGLGDHVAAVVVHVDGAHDDVNLSPKQSLFEVRVPVWSNLDRAQLVELQLLIDGNSVPEKS